MTSEQGAYTLLVTSASNGWKKNEVKLKNPTRPLLSRDYSILEYADQIKALSGAKRFKYRLEANERRHWGGVWTAPMRYRWVITQHNYQRDMIGDVRFSITGSSVCYLPRRRYIHINIMIYLVYI